MSRRFHQCFLILCLFAAYPIRTWAQPQEPKLDNIANQIVQQLKKAEKKHFSPKVSVIDFTLQPGGIRALGKYMADQLSDTLTQKVSLADVIDRKRLYSYLQDSGVSPLDLADPEAAAWIAGQIGASVIVFGRLTPSEGNVRLSSDLIRVDDGKRLGSSKIDFVLTDQLKQLLSKPWDWPASADVVMECAPGANADSFRAAGLTMPTCIHCPNPDYNDAARKAGFQGDLKFDVVVDESGRAKRITVIKGDKNGLTARAIDAIKGWKFKPAMRNGQPVTVCVTIEVVFRLF